MCSNEHPDMSGNPCDAPFVCAKCGRDVQEEKAFGSSSNDELMFCSSVCVGEWEDDRLELLHGVD